MKKIIFLSFVLYLFVLIGGCAEKVPSAPSATATPSGPINTPTITPTATVAATEVIKPWGVTSTASAFDGRVEFSGCTVNGYMWVIGGSSSDVPSGDGDVWRSADGSAWTEVVAYGTVAELGRWGHKVVSHNYEIYVIAGGSGGGFGKDVFKSANGVDWNAVTKNAQFPGRRHHAALSFNNKLWVIGGYDGGYYNDVWWSADGADWNAATRNAEFGTRYSHTAAVYNNKMWVIGGFGYGCTNPFASWNMNDVWSSSDGVTWTNTSCAAPFAVAKGGAAIEYNGRLWYLGASSPAAPTDADQAWWTLDGTNWTKANVPTFTARSRHLPLVFNDGSGEKMWVIGGGYYSGDKYNDVWYAQNSN